VALTGCLTPPPRCTCEDTAKKEDGGAASPKSKGTKISVEAQLAELGLEPVVPLAPLIWSGESNMMINIDPPGSWFAYNDGTPEGVMTPPSAAEFSNFLEGGAIHTTGKGFKTWGGGIGFNMVGAQMLTPVDASKYKGVKFEAWGSGWVHVGLATAITVPEFGICTTCYDHYAVDIKLSEEPKVYEYPWDKLRQAGWGSPKGKLDTATLIGMHFTSKGATPWDIHIDDVSFIE
jgi:hypothetical protein